MITASLLGMDAVTVRDLAGDLGMSKSGVLAPFASREQLLTEAFDAAVATFRAAVVVPALSRPAGATRLRALADHWIDHLTDCPFPGGCFLTTASVEQDNRAGVLHDRAAATMTRWLDYLTDEAHAARPRSSARRARDLAVTMNGIAMTTNRAVQLLADPEAATRGRRLMRAAIAAFLA